MLLQVLLRRLAIEMMRMLVMVEQNIFPPLPHFTLPQETCISYGRSGNLELKVGSLLPNSLQKNEGKTSPGFVAVKSSGNSVRALSTVVFHGGLQLTGFIMFTITNLSPISSMKSRQINAMICLPQNSQIFHRLLRITITESG